MKQKIKRIFLAALLCMTVILGTLTTAYAAKTVSAEDEAMVRSVAEQVLQSVVTLDDASLDNYAGQAEMMGDPVLAAGLQNWKQLRSELGPFVSMDSTRVIAVDNGYQANVQIICGERQADVAIGFDDQGKFTRFSFEKVETLSEKLESAFFNMLIGMGTVFAVLLFIAFIISRFKVINVYAEGIEKKKKADAEYAALVEKTKKLPGVAKNVSKRITPEMVRAAVIPEGVKIELIPEKTEEAPAKAEDTGLDPQLIAVLSAAVAAADSAIDPQLVAVITAAIMEAAGTDAGPDGLVVRSIRRASGAKWKRA